MSLIEVRELSAYYNRHPVFEKMSFQIDKGDYLCIIGENGSGKTTLMKCILGIDVRYSGQIIYNGLERSKIGYLPQTANIKPDFPASVFEIVMSGFAGRRKLGLSYSAAQKRQAEETLALLEISELKKNSFMELSGGQRQRVLLCRALCAADSVILLDEPETALDQSGKTEFSEQMRRLNRDGLTVIEITHDIEHSVRLASKILHLGNNDFFFGKTEDYTKYSAERAATEELQ